MTRENEHINSSSEVIRTRKYTHNDRSIRGSDLAHKKMLIGITEERQSRNDVKTQSGGNKRKMTVIPSWPTNFSGLDRQQQKALLNITGGHQNSGKIKKNATFPAVRNTSSKNKKLNASRNNQWKGQPIANFTSNKDKAHKGSGTSVGMKGSKLPMNSQFRKMHSYIKKRTLQETTQTTCDILRAQTAALSPVNDDPNQLNCMALKTAQKAIIGFIDRSKKPGSAKSRISKRPTMRDNNSQTEQQIGNHQAFPKYVAIAIPSEDIQHIQEEDIQLKTEHAIGLKNIEASTDIQLFQLNRCSVENIQETLFEGPTQKLSQICGSLYQKNDVQRSQISSHDNYEPLEATMTEAADEHIQKIVRQKATEKIRQKGIKTNYGFPRQHLSVIDPKSKTAISPIQVSRNREKKSVSPVPYYTKMHKGTILSDVSRRSVGVDKILSAKSDNMFDKHDQSQIKLLQSMKADSQQESIAGKINRAIETGGGCTSNVTNEICTHRNQAEQTGFDTFEISKKDRLSNFDNMRITDPQILTANSATWNDQFCQSSHPNDTVQTQPRGSVQVIDSESVIVNEALQRVQAEIIRKEDNDVFFSGANIMADPDLNEGELYINQGHVRRVTRQLGGTPAYRFPTQTMIDFNQLAFTIDRQTNNSLLRSHHQQQQQYLTQQQPPNSISSPIRNTLSSTEREYSHREPSAQACMIRRRVQVKRQNVIQRIRKRNNTLQENINAPRKSNKRGQASTVETRNCTKPSKSSLCSPSLRTTVMDNSKKERIQTQLQQESERENNIVVGKCLKPKLLFKENEMQLLYDKAQQPVQAAIKKILLGQHDRDVQCASQALSSRHTPKQNQLQLQGSSKFRQHQPPQPKLRRKSYDNIKLEFIKSLLQEPEDELSTPKTIQEIIDQYKEVLENNLEGRSALPSSALNSTDAPNSLTGQKQIMIQPNRQPQTLLGHKKVNQDLQSESDIDIERPSQHRQDTLEQDYPPLATKKSKEKMGLMRGSLAINMSVMTNIDAEPLSPGTVTENLQKVSSNLSEQQHNLKSQDFEVVCQAADGSSVVQKNNSQNYIPVRKTKQSKSSFRSIKATGDARRITTEDKNTKVKMIEAAGIKSPLRLMNFLHSNDNVQYSQVQPQHFPFKQNLGEYYKTYTTVSGSSTVLTPVHNSPLMKKKAPNTKPKDIKVLVSHTADDDTLLNSPMNSDLVIQTGAQSTRSIASNIIRQPPGFDKSHPASSAVTNVTVTNEVAPPELRSVLSRIVAKQQSELVHKPKELKFTGFSSRIQRLEEQIKLNMKEPQVKTAVDVQQVSKVLGFPQNETMQSPVTFYSHRNSHLQTQKVASAYLQLQADMLMNTRKKIVGKELKDTSQRMKFVQQLFSDNQRRMSHQQAICLNRKQSLERSLYKRRGSTLRAVKPASLNNNTRNKSTQSNTRDGATNTHDF